MIYLKRGLSIYIKKMIYVCIQTWDIYVFPHLSVTKCWSNYLSAQSVKAGGRKRRNVLALPCTLLDGENQT